MASEAKTALILGPGRLSFPHLLRPQKNDAGEDRYSTVILLPPDYDLSPLREALQGALVKKFGADKSKWPKKLRMPEDVIKLAADSDHYSALPPGWRYVNASAAAPPGVVNGVLEDVTDNREVYPGRWARMSVNAYGYDSKGNRGVTLGLNNVQLLRHDDPLAGKRRARDEFDAMAEDMEDAKEEAWD